MVPKQQTGDDDALAKLNEAIEDLNRAKEVSSIALAKAVFGSTSDLLPMIRVSLIPFRQLLANVRRIRWSIGRAMWDWDWLAPMSAKPLTGD